MTGIVGMTQSLIVPARTSQDIDITRTLFRAYQMSIDTDLCFQHFEAELASLPGKYAPPLGEILLAWDLDRRPLGCVALRPLDRPGVCEMKRLYVTPEGRGRGLGRALLDAIIAKARKTGYREVWLDTLPDMAAAQELYRSAGFETGSSYYETPIDGTVFMRLDLA